MRRSMAQKTNMRLIGAIENMTGDVFGRGGGAALAEELGVPLLGEIPLDPRLREQGDLGTPLVSADPELADRARDRRARGGDRRDASRRRRRHRQGAARSSPERGRVLRSRPDAAAALVDARARAGVPQARRDHARAGGKGRVLAAAVRRARDEQGARARGVGGGADASARLHAETDARARRRGARARAPAARLRRAASSRRTPSRARRAVVHRLRGAAGGRRGDGRTTSASTVRSARSARSRTASTQGAACARCTASTRRRRSASSPSSTGMTSPRSTAYSDSHTDLPFLEAVGKPVAVNPDRALASRRRRARLAGAEVRRSCSLRRPAAGSRRSASPTPTSRRSVRHFDDAERRGKLGHGYARIPWLETLPDLDPDAQPRGSARDGRLRALGGQRRARLPDAGGDRRRAAGAAARARARDRGVALLPHRDARPLRPAARRRRARRRC